MEIKPGSRKTVSISAIVILCVLLGLALWRGPGRREAPPLEPACVPAAVDGDHWFVIEGNGILKSWGVGMNGFTSQTMVKAQERYPVFEGAISVWSGQLVTLVLDQEGALWATGDNIYGQLGSGVSGQPASSMRKSGN